MELNEIKCEYCQKKMQWIPTSERLPKENSDEEYILCITGVAENIHYHNAVVSGECYFEDGKFFIHGCYLSDVTVHAWMPMPEAYFGGY